MTLSYKLLNQVVDTLYLRVSVNRLPSDWLQRRCETWKAHQEEWEEDPRGTDNLLEEIPELGTFTVLPAKSPYRFVLVNPELCDIRIWNPNKWETAVGGETGQFYIAFRSRFLQHNGVEAALKYTKHVISRFCGEAMSEGKVSNPEFTRISRVDLAVDTQEPRGMIYQDLDRYTCRSRKRDAFLEPLSEALETAWQRQKNPKTKTSVAEFPLLNNKGGDSCIGEMAMTFGISPQDVQTIGATFLEAYGADPNPAMVSRLVSSGSRDLQTVYFGRFGSELFARRYDKLASLEVQGKEYMKEVWKAAGWNEDLPVWRTEFSLSGDFLKHVMHEGKPQDLREAQLFLASLPAVWKYLTHDWLRHCNPSEDKTVSRWETSDFWCIVQDAWQAKNAVVRHHVRLKPDKDKLTQQIHGCMVSLLAVTSSERYQRATQESEASEPLNVFFDQLYEVSSNNYTKAKIKRRMQEFGLDPLSDTVFSSFVRTEQMSFGFGS